MILALVMGILLLISRIDIKESSKKILNFIKKYFWQAVIAIIFILSTCNLVYNSACSMEIIRTESSKVSQNAYAILINIYERIINNLKEYDKRCI